jgi:DNA end-binding protein Ku
VPADQKEPSEREKQLALHLVEELSGPFDPARHPDEYRNAVLAAVEQKIEAGEVARESAEEAPAAAASTGAQVIDLAELLSRSIKAAGKPGPAKARSDEEVEEQKVEKAAATATKGAKKGKRATG